MTKLLVATLFCWLAVNVVRADDPPAPPANAPKQQAVADAQKACATDIQTLCPGVQPGGGRILQCLKARKESVSDGCKQAIQKALQPTS